MGEISNDMTWKGCAHLASYDITEIEDMIAGWGPTPLFTRKKKPEAPAPEVKKQTLPSSSHRAHTSTSQPSWPVFTTAQSTRRGSGAWRRCWHTTSRSRRQSRPSSTLRMRRRECQADPAKARWMHGLCEMAVWFLQQNPLHVLQLPPEAQAAWHQKVTVEGKRPLLVYDKRTGLQLRGLRERPESPPAGDVPPTAPAQDAKAPAAEPPATPPKRYKFPLLWFDDMRPGVEPNYLVDELIPVAGLVVVYGAPKSGKSFWTLDLMMHVALGWEYRDRYVQQGTVVYCAFEGAHGYHKRIEAFRRHHCLTDEKPPLCVVPGRADLVKDHATLIANIKEQVGGRDGVGPVRAVVLDTLNKSLIGSESKDVDMANYIAAAEAIQKAFSCVVIIVHHHGIDESRPRGHTSLRGALDAQLKVTRGESEAEKGTIVVELEDMRDGPEGAQITSRLVVVDVGTDRSGKPLTSAAIEPVAPGTFKRRVKMTKNQATMFSLLEEAGPDGLSADEWNERARSAGLGIRRRADLRDFRNVLLRHKLVLERGDRWFIATKPQPDANWA